MRQKRCGDAPHSESTACKKFEQSSVRYEIGRTIPEKIGRKLAFPFVRPYRCCPTIPYFMKSSLICLLLVSAALSSNLYAAAEKSVDDFRAAATKANSVLTIPDWEQTPEAIDAAMKDAIAKANQALDQIGSQDASKVTFKSTVIALDDLAYQAGLTANKANIIKQTSPNAAMRTAGENAVKIYQDWAVGIDYREDVYKVI